MKNLFLFVISLLVFSSCESYQKEKKTDLTRTEIIKMIVAHGSDLNLRGVYLKGINLSKLDLKDANLTGANLYNANLTGANLEGVIGYGPHSLRS